MNNEFPVHLQAPAAALSCAPGAPGLSVVVPVYRGAATIGHLVQALSALEPQGGLEIVLVNDGSPDNSAEICTALAGQHARADHLHRACTQLWRA